MAPIVIDFGGYQKPASVHTRAAALFGEILVRELGERVRFELIGDVLALGRKSGDLLPMVERGELSCCYISTVRFTHAVPEFRLLELPFVVRDRSSINAALAANGDPHVGLFEGREKLAGGHHAVEPLIVIDGVDVIDGFQFLRRAGQVVDGLADRQVLVDHGHFRGHHRAGRIFGIFTQPQNLTPLVSRQ